jgi:hypothetical protein
VLAVAPARSRCPQRLSQQQQRHQPHLLLGLLLLLLLAMLLLLLVLMLLLLFLRDDRLAAPAVLHCTETFCCCIQYSPHSSADSPIAAAAGAEGARSAPCYPLSSQVPVLLADLACVVAHQVAVAAAAAEHGSYPLLLLLLSVAAVSHPAPMLVLLVAAADADM